MKEVSQDHRDRWVLLDLKVKLESQELQEQEVSLVCQDNKVNQEKEDYLEMFLASMVLLVHLVNEEMTAVLYADRKGFASKHNGLCYRVFLACLASLD